MLLRQELREPVVCNAIISAVAQGAGVPLFGELQADLNACIGKAFEAVCLQYMIRRNNVLAQPFLFTLSRRWWGGIRGRGGRRK